jgi:IclR family acetate operon transcriptional repressor
MAKTANRTGPLPVQSVSRSLDLLDAVATGDHSLVALASKTNLTPSTAYRLLSTLMDRGYVARSAETGRFRVGHKVIELAAVAASATDRLRVLIRPYLESLRDATEETANLVVPEGVSVVYADQVESARAVRMFTVIGRRVPMHASAAGKAILAASPEGVLNARLAAGLEVLTTHTLATAESLRRDLDLTRERGFAVDREEYDLGVSCVACPITDARAHAVAALSVSGPSERMRAADLEALGAVVRDHARNASQELGADMSAAPTPTTSLRAR